MVSDCILVFMFVELIFFFFFFNDTATTEIYTLSLHDALPIFTRRSRQCTGEYPTSRVDRTKSNLCVILTIVCSDFVKYLKKDRKSTRLNSSHANISYAVFCLKKKIKNMTSTTFRY